METFNTQINNEQVTKKINIKLIFIILTVVVLLELVYLGYVLVKTSKVSPAQPAISPVGANQKTIVSLDSDMDQIKVGEKISVVININSVKFTEAIDIVIKYDPQKLTVLNPVPVLVGSMYENYPVNKVDQVVGKVSVSGVAPLDQPVVPKGEFGKIEFIAKESGPTTVSVDFTPNETKDSNIFEIKTIVDVLEEVENVDINILP